MFDCPARSIISRNQTRFCRSRPGFLPALPPRRIFRNCLGNEQITGTRLQKSVEWLAYELRDSSKFLRPKTLFTNCTPALDQLPTSPKRFPWDTDQPVRQINIIDESVIRQSCENGFLNRLGNGPIVTFPPITPIDVIVPNDEVRPTVSLTPIGRKQSEPASGRVVSPSMANSCVQIHKQVVATAARTSKN